MSSKKKMKRNSSNKFNEYKVSSHPQRKLHPPDEPDVSRILKVAETEELGEPDDSFDHPLHSTAVDAYGEEHAENESLRHLSDPQRKNTEKSKRTHHLKMSEDDVYKFKTGDSEDEPFKENMWAHNRNIILEHIPALCNVCVYSVVSVVDNPGSVRVWCPKGLKRLPKDITELDVVLAEFEKIAADYKQRVDSNICRKAIDGFCSGFKDQITDLVSTHIDLFRTETQLKQLQREYAQLQERKSSLRHATQFLTDLKELQQDCLDYREEHPKEKVVYGTSSLPALLVESRRILGVERHFKNINARLQEALDVQREKLSKKH
uniref:Centromere protein U n=1 Tax=Apteryx owenii TaxID=8824 RepID=A0A8B9Q3J7_APTOW